MIAVIVLKSVLYDGWRQMYFIYPALVLMALVGLKWITGMARGRKAVLAAMAVVVTLSCANIAYFMVRSHPHQFIYFNMFMGKGMEKAQGNFDLDYWGISYKKDLEYLVKNDPDSRLSLFIFKFDLNPLCNSFMLPASDQKRFLFTQNPLADSEYYITNHRWTIENEPKGERLYTVKVDDLVLSTIYRFKKPRPEIIHINQ